MPDNVEAHHGVLQEKDEVQRRTRLSGVVHLEKANVMNEKEVIATIEEQVHQGKQGQSLADALRKRYSYKPGEERPTPVLGKPTSLSTHINSMNKN